MWQQFILQCYMLHILFTIVSTVKYAYFQAANPKPIPNPIVNVVHYYYSLLNFVIRL